MLEELATVVKVEKNRVWVSPQISSGCGDCLQKTTCPSSIVERFMKPRVIEVSSSFPLAVGDNVIVTVDESLLLNAALLLYLFPLLAMSISAGLAESIMDNAEGYVALAGLGGLTLALAFLHIAQKFWLADYGVRAEVVKKI